MVKSLSFHATIESSRLQYDDEPDGLYFIYGVEEINGKKERYYVNCVDVHDVATSLAQNAAMVYDYTYVKKFGEGTVFVTRRPATILAKPQDRPRDTGRPNPT